MPYVLYWSSSEGVSSLQIARRLSKEQYLGKIASGEIDYQIWESDTPISVRVYHQVALLRYRSRLDIVDGGHPVGLRHYWHTDSYE
jgi:hypothetical protein